MAEYSVEEFSKQLQAKGTEISTDKLIEQLKLAGVAVAEPSDLLDEDARQKLLDALLTSHGTQVQAKKRGVISIRRTETEEVAVKGADGRKATVLVKKKRRRHYVKKSALTEEEVAPESEATAATSTDAVELPEQPSAEPEVKPEEPVKEEADKAEESIVEEKPKAAEAAPAKPAPEKADATKTAAGKRPSKKGKSFEEEKESADKAKKKAGKVTRTTRDKVKNKQQLLSGGEELHIRRRAKSRRKNTESEAEVNPHAFAKPTEPVTLTIQVPETITVSDLARNMSIKAADLIKKLMQMGVMATINQMLDQDTAMLLVEELGHQAEAEKLATVEDTLIEETGNFEAVSRAPIVTVMGHVDHGKTSLLDYIRTTRVTSSESGGITQHIGAYQVSTSKGQVTFLDTPGHSAFTAMRARGANCTDLVILVVAADDGVMPQTIEAIQHAKAAKVPIVVAVNKMDKPEADPDKVTNELSQFELIPEAWGGDTLFVQVSAKSGQGIDELLEGVMLQAEMLELKAPAQGSAKGVVIESKLDRGRGAVATLLVTQGQLKQGDMVLAGLEYGRVRALIDDQGKSIAQAGPATPVEVLGLSDVPAAGDEFVTVNDERKAREVAEFRQSRHRDLKLSRQQASKLEGFMDKMKKGETKVLNIVLKADVHGSIEALADALQKLTHEEVKVRIVAQGVGAFNESDINLAMASDAILIGFNVRADNVARKLAQEEGVEINYFSVIYDIIDAVKKAIGSKLGTIVQEKIVGTAEVRDVFRSSKIGSIAGCMVIDGTIKRGNPIRVLRDNVVIYEGELESLRRFKENVNEVRNNMECGIGVKDYNDVKVGDQIEVFEKIEVARTID